LILLARVPGSGAKLRCDLRALLLLVMLLLTFTSMITSDYVAYSWRYWLEFAKALTVTYVMSGLVTDVKKYRQVVLVIALSLGFEGAKQAYVQLLTNPGARNLNVIGVLGDTNGMAVGMLMLAGLFTALVQTAGGRRERWLHQFFFVGVAYRAISTYSRGGFLAAGALGLVYVLRSKQKIKAIIGIAVTATVILSVLPDQYWERISTIQIDQSKLKTGNADDESALARFHFWEVAINMAKENPGLGIGFNAFNVAYDRHDFSNGFYGRARSVHSSWLGVLAEIGIPGFVVYVSIILLAFFGAHGVASRSRRGEAPPELYHYAVAIQAGLAAFVVGGSFVPWQYNEMLWHFVGLSMGLRNLARVPYTAPVREPVTVPRPEPTFEPAHAFRSS
jgi:probable O-glycosylation ligase (exosortase A-associated)